MSKLELYNNKTGKMLYSINASFSHKTVIISNDGKNLIVVNDWPHYSNKKVLNVLEFYSIGKSIQSVKFIDCMTDTSNISMSVSHFNWLMDFTIEKNNITLK